MRRLLSIPLILFCYLLPAALFAAPPYQTFELKNGMQVIVIPNHRIPAVTHMVWYKTGAINEVPGKTGIAHYLEHLMFKGTGLTKAGEFSSTIAKNGGHDNAFTSYDYTAYFQVIPKDSLEKVMALESDRMVNLKVPESDAVSEKQVVIEERRTRLENQPEARLGEQIRAALYPNHPYGISVLGQRKDMENLALNDVMDFYKSYYAPNNAILVVAGDVEPDQVKILAEKYYGNIPAREIKKPAVLQLSPVKIHEVTLHDSLVKQKELSIYFRVPSVNSKENKELSFPLLLLSQILGGGTNSRLYQHLVVDKKQAIDLGSYYNEIALIDTDFTIHGLPADKIGFKQLENSINTEIKNIAENGVSPEELSRAKNLLESEVIYSREGIKALASIYGEALASNLPPEYVEQWPAKVEAVTSEQIKSAAQFLLYDENKVTGHLLP